MRAEQGARQVRGAGGAGVSAGQGLRGAGGEARRSWGGGSCSCRRLRLSAGRVPALRGSARRWRGARGGAWRFPPSRRPSARRGRWRRGVIPVPEGSMAGVARVSVLEGSREGWMGRGPIA